MYISKSSDPNTNPLGIPKVIVNIFFYLGFLQGMAEQPSYKKKKPKIQSYIGKPIRKSRKIWGIKIEMLLDYRSKKNILLQLNNSIAV